MSQGFSVLPAPVVTITNPGSPGQQVSFSSFSFHATVKNITSSAQLSVLLNGTQVNNFTFNTASNLITVPANLNPGSNTLVITATNSSGSDTKATSIIYAGNPPVVTITNPASSPYAASTTSTPIKAQVTNVTSQGDIKLYVNNIPDNSFTFNAATGTVDYNLALNNATPAYVVTIAGTNIWGSDSKSVTINNNVVTTPKPVVIISSPATSPFTSATAAHSVVATVLNVAGKNNITVTSNGAAVGNFTYNMLTKQVTVPLTLSPNLNTVVTITGTNTAGSDTKSTTLNYVPKPIVSYINPASDPHAATSTSQSVTAEVKHVTSQSQVNVLVNGVTQPFTWNSSTNRAVFTATVNPGNNIVTVTGTNTAGSDTKSMVISYENKPRGARPVVTITNPAVSGTTVNTAQYNFTANVTNVTSVSNVTVTLNGNVVNAQFNNGVVNYASNLSQGVNTFAVAASNNFGSDQASTTIIYALPVQDKKPVVTITNPPTSGTTVASAPFAFTASVAGVVSSSQLVVQFNGNAVPFQFVNNIVTYNATLIPGNNTFAVTATNSGGSASASTSINYVTAVINPPVVTITNPSAPGTTVSSASYQFTANITNIQTASQLTVTLNGNTAGAMYSNGVMTLNTNLVAGTNNLTVTASNSAGSDAKSTTIIYAQPLPAPIITFTQPSAPGQSESAAAFLYKATILNVTGSSQLTVKFNGAVTTGFSFAPGLNSFTYLASLVSGQNTLEITATNNSGSDYKSTYVVHMTSAPGGGNEGGGNNDPQITICHYPPGNTSNPQVITIPQSAWAAHQAHGDVLGGNCPSASGGNNDPQITICHYPPGNPANPQVITIPQSAWAAHQAHGDVLGGTCPPKTTDGVKGGDNDNDPQITICHYPPGNPANPQVITIPQSAWAAHQAHGDVLGGTCPPKSTGGVVGGNGDNDNNDPQISICHFPPDKPNKSEVITIAQSEWPAHQAHGDILGGTCPSSGGNTGGSTNETKIYICHYPSNDPNNPQVIQIYQAEWPQHQAHGDVLGGTCPSTNSGTGSSKDPQITICHYPPGNTSNPQVITIAQSAWPAHQAHGDVLGGTCPSTGNNGGGNNGGGNNNGGGGNNNDPQISICHYPPGNTSNPQVITIAQSAWPAHQAHGDVLGGTCPSTGNNGGGNNNGGGGNSGGNTGLGSGGPFADPQITICHYPPGNTSNPQVIQISQSAWPAHQAHGDVQGGTCPSSGNSGGGNGNSNSGSGNSGGGGNSNNNDPQITICHYPPGNTDNPQVITISQSAWPAHLAHGDVLGGTCPSQTKNNNNNNGSGNGNGGGGKINNSNTGGGTKNSGNNSTNNSNSNSGGGGLKPLNVIKNVIDNNPNKGGSNNNSNSGSNNATNTTNSNSSNQSSGSGKPNNNQSSTKENETNTTVPKTTKPGLPKLPK